MHGFSVGVMPKYVILMAEMVGLPTSWKPHGQPENHVFPVFAMETATRGLDNFYSHPPLGCDTSTFLPLAEILFVPNLNKSQFQ